SAGRGGLAPAGRGRRGPRCRPDGRGAAGGAFRPPRGVRPLGVHGGRVAAAARGGGCGPGGRAAGLRAALLRRPGGREVCAPSPAARRLHYAHDGHCQPP
nr:hypothetical protein [Tanacetum cinerariifolium]